MARRIFCPVLPTTSEKMLVSWMFICVSAFCMRCTCVPGFSKASRTGATESAICTRLRSSNMYHCFSDLPWHRIPLCHIRIVACFFGAICGIGPIILLPQKSMDATCVISASIQRLFPCAHRDGFSNSLYETTSSKVD